MGAGYQTWMLCKNINVLNCWTIAPGQLLIPLNILWFRLCFWKYRNKTERGCSPVLMSLTSTCRMPGFGPSIVWRTKANFSVAVEKNTSDQGNIKWYLMWGSHFQRISVHAYQAGRHSTGAIVESSYLIHKHKARERAHWEWFGLLKLQSSPRDSSPPIWPHLFHQGYTS